MILERRSNCCFTAPLTGLAVGLASCAMSDAAHAANTSVELRIRFMVISLPDLRGGSRINERSSYVNQKAVVKGELGPLSGLSYYQTPVMRQMDLLAARVQCTIAARARSDAFLFEGRQDGWQKRSADIR